MGTSLYKSLLLSTGGFCVSDYIRKFTVRCFFHAGRKSIQPSQNKVNRDANADTVVMFTALLCPSWHERQKNDLRRSAEYIDNICYMEKVADV